MVDTAAGADASRAPHAGRACGRRGQGQRSTVKVDVRDANVGGVTIVMHPPQ